MTRILHVLATPRAEGTPNLVLDWLAARPDHWQGVVVLHADPPDLADRLRAGAMAYEEHRLFGPRSVGKFVGIARAAHAAVRRHRPDVLVCWPTGFANWVCGGAFAAGCRRLLVHAGNPPVRGGKADWMSRYIFWPLAAVRAEVVCCSDYVRDQFRAIPWVPGRFRTVYNCARAAAIRDRAGRVAKPPGGPTAVMVATLEAHKDHHTLLRAVPAVAQRWPGFRLRLVGDGSLRPALEVAAAAAGVLGVVEFLGTRLDVPEQLARADLFVFSTTPQEGLGTVLIEALAAGLPVVATDVPACREVLRGGEYGRLVPPGDPAALAAAVAAALEDPPDPRAAARRVEYACGFSPDRMVDEYLSPARRGGRP